MTKKARLRFAPSPTGFIHLGSLRTVLFTYLLAKHFQGSFILRIEDTDQARLVPNSLNNLLEVLSWLGLNFDEGPHLGGQFGPYLQSERLEIYQKHCQILLTTGAAYRCFCSSEHLEKKREEQMAAKQAPRYDRRCRDLDPKEALKRVDKGESFVIRQAMPLSGQVIVTDELRGPITFSAADLEDQVLMKSNAYPTYQLASVVDDHLMAISHVTRGEEWIPSFPKNILLYQAFAWEPPQFIHLPLILNQGGGKLSKRQGDVFVEDYQRQGYLPAALINFCVLLGWHPKDDQEIFTLAELEKNFSLAGLGASPAIFDWKKLLYFNGFYLRRRSLSDLADLARPFMISAGLLKSDSSPTENEKYLKVLKLAQERIKTLAELPLLFAFFFKDINYQPKLLLGKNLDFPQVTANLKELLIILSGIEHWTLENLELQIINYLRDNQKKNADYLWPLRVALSGEKFSPGPFEIAWALGREESLNRLQQAIKLISC